MTQAAFATPDSISNLVSKDASVWRQKARFFFELARISDEAAGRIENISRQMDRLNRGEELIDPPKVTRLGMKGTETIRERARKMWVPCPQGCGTKHRLNKDPKKLHAHMIGYKQSA